MTLPGGSPQILRNRLKMRQLMLLHVLGETGHLRRSAERLGMTQPAATKLLQDLEATLGVPLFERSRRGMTPTLFGDTMIRFATSLLSELDAAQHEIGALAEGAKGVVRVGIMTSTYSEVVARALVSLLQHRPGVRVSVMEGTHEMLLAALRRGDLDLVLGRVMGGAAMDDVALEWLYEDAFVVVCGPQHPVLRGPVTAAALQGYGWVLPHSTTPVRQRVEILLMELTGKRPHAVVECASLLTNVSLLQQSSLLSVMPRDVVQRFAEYGLVRQVPVALSAVPGPVLLITQPNRPVSPAVQAFLVALREGAAGAGAV